jgi:hypothetical protein
MVYIAKGRGPSLNKNSYETTPKWHGFLMIRLAAFQASGAAHMKLHLFRQDLQDYQDYFVLVCLYPAHPVDPVRKIKLYFVKFFFRLDRPFLADGWADT